MMFGIPRSEEPNLYLLGIAWDGSSSYRRGAAQGPAAIREATSSKLYNSYTEDLVNLADAWSYMDLGDIAGRTFDEVVGKVERVVGERYRGELFLFLGGDHSITYAAFRALRRVAGRMGLIYFDAHPDLYPSYDGDPYSHACTLRRLVEEGLVRGEDVVIVGVRAPTPEQARFAEEHGISIIDVVEARRNPGINVSASPVYLSFDLDVLDPAYAPGVGNPEPGGLSTRELIDTVRSLNVEVAGFDVVELVPSHDPSGVTALAAAKIVREVLGLAARRARGSPGSPRSPP